ncbi:MAG: ABC transporter permease [Thermoanaerobaculia bacterium]|nr:ABC transporter permease [Thermoanaerobaculia bacterium]
MSIRMLPYYLRLATKSLLATPGLTLLTLVALGLGIAVPTASLSIRHVFGQDPFPEKSDRLFNVRLDNWETESEFFGPAGEPPKHITYQDMVRVRELTPEIPSTGIGAASIFLFPPDESLRPYQVLTRLCHSDFFSMFNAPFTYGDAWSEESDRNPDHVAVLSHEGNQKLFGGQDSVGKKIRLGEQEFEVVGVLAPWRPTPQIYDTVNNPYGTVREIFVPFEHVLDDALGLQRATSDDAFGSRPQGGTLRETYMAWELNWIQFWAELAPSELALYRQTVDDYSLAQKELGRFPRPLNNRVQPLMGWLEEQAIQRGAGPGTDALVIVSVLFLLVCCLNLTGLLLAKFLARSGILGIHRALGAPMRSIFMQRLVECVLVATAGGVLGAILAGGALRLLDQTAPDRFLRPGIFSLDSYSLVAALVLALGAGLLSGVYPAWRACRIAPAIQLKVQ